VPRGLITLLAGESGTGKSYLALELAHRLAVRSEFPDGTAIEGPGVTLYVDAENTPQVMKRWLIDWRPEEQRRLFLLRPEEERMEHYCLPTVIANINRLGGVDRGRMVPRRVHPDGPGAAQQLSIFDDLDE
jgi:hypothetical protein